MRVFDLPLDEGQVMLDDGLARYLADRDRADWDGLAADLGLMGIGVAEAAGGVGGGGVERALVMAALGPSFLGGAWLAHSLASGLLADVAPGHAALDALVAGTQRVALVTGLSAEAQGASWTFSGRADVVAGADTADWLMLVSDAAIALVPADAAGVERRVRIMHDGSGAADVAVAAQVASDAVLATGADAAALADQIGDAWLTGLAAEACGLMARMMATTVDYMGQRKQFGLAISSFQVLRHRMADMQMAMMKAVALTEVAVLAEGDAPARRGHKVAAACVEVGEAIRFVGEQAVQIHGAMGLTEELSLGGLYKRGLAIGAALGPLSAQLARHAATAAA